MRRQRPTQRQRLAVFIRAGYRCEYCRHPVAFSSDPFEVEHIIPVEQGGTTTLDNLALSCRGCNHLKHILTEAMDPATGVTVPLFHPRHQQWSAHFQWSFDATQVLALTATGRATLEALQLNREGLRNLRRALVLDGAHPPDESVTI